MALNSRKKFRIKKKPEKPLKKNCRSRRQTEEIMYSYASRDISEFAAAMQALAVEYPGATVETDLNYDGCYYESDTPACQLILVHHTTVDEEYEKALKRYKADLKRYNEWYKLNKDNIEKELALREEEKKEALRCKAKSLRNKADRIEKSL